MVTVIAFTIHFKEISQQYSWYQKDFTVLIQM